MADDKKHLVPMFIIYADGARLDTEHEGAVRRIRVSDRLDGIGRCVIEFGHPAAALLEKGAIVPESAVDVHLGYKDECGKVFGGEVTGLEYGYSEHCGEYLRVTVSGRLHRLRNAVRSMSYERKTAGGFVTEMLDRYGLKADVEDFGPEREVSVHHLESDWDVLIEHAKRYGRSVYEQDGTVYIKNEITVSQEDIVLEFGKSMISFRVKECLAAQISKCTYTGWNMTKAEEITGSAEVGEVPVKAGGGTSWSDEARILPGMWESVIDSQGVTDAEDARNRALGELQNASMEWQRAEVRCEGDHRIRPGMRVTLKYVGERFSGEYVAERVEHEFGIDGFITEVHLRRNMLPGEPKRASAIDEERERQHNGGVASEESSREDAEEQEGEKNRQGSQNVILKDESRSVQQSVINEEMDIKKDDEQTVREWLYKAAKFIRENAKLEYEVMLSKKLDEMLNTGKIQLDNVQKRYETPMHIGHLEDTYAFFDPFQNTETGIPRKIIVIDVRKAKQHGYGEFIDTVAHEACHAVQSDMGLISVNASNKLQCTPSKTMIEWDACCMGDNFYNKYASQNGLPLKRLPKI